MSEYSGTPIKKKLGINDDFSILLINAPTNYSEYTETILKNSTIPFDFIHIFTKSEIEFRKEFLKAKDLIKKSGMIWVSWPKAASKIPTDLNENKIRDFAIENGLVDIKVAAFDEIWSALKIVWRIKNR